MENKRLKATCAAMIASIIVAVANALGVDIDPETQKILIGAITTLLGLYIAGQTITDVKGKAD